MRVEFDAEALDELREARDWYENESPGLGVALRDELQRTVTRITQNPQLYSVEHRGIRRAPLNRFPYSVFYYVVQEPALVYIFAVFHQSRNPTRLQGRLQNFNPGSVG